MFLTEPVLYLESSDFDDHGNIIYNQFLPRNTPVMILLQSNSCVYCNKAKIDFQRFAEYNRDKIISATIQFDAVADPKFDTLNLNFSNEKVNKIYSNLKGFPSYILYIDNIKYKYEGNRDFESLNGFMKNLI
jgi:thiol-disulfide isomerase/thioredoxin